jgi:hemin uptake protein HemP
MLEACGQKVNSPKHRNSGRQRAEIPAKIDSFELLGDRRQVIIHHKGEDYCLSVTRHDKLILTK